MSDQVVVMLVNKNTISRLGPLFTSKYAFLFCRGTSGNCFRRNNEHKGIFCHFKFVVDESICSNSHQIVISIKKWKNIRFQFWDNTVTCCLLISSRTSVVLSVREPLKSAWNEPSGCWNKVSSQLELFISISCCLKCFTLHVQSAISWREPPRTIPSNKYGFVMESCDGILHNRLCFWLTFHHIACATLWFDNRLDETC